MENKTKRRLSTALNIFAGMSLMGAYYDTTIDYVGWAVFKVLAFATLTVIASSLKEE